MTFDHPGANLRRLRLAQRMSQRVIAELAGITPGYLSRLENGLRALDNRALITRLADALRVTPQDIVGRAIPTHDTTTQLATVRTALYAVAVGEHDGHPTPLPELHQQAIQALTAARDCDYHTATTVLPTLLRNLHATLDTGNHTRDVAKLATLVHIQAAQATIGALGADHALMWTTADLARRIAEHADDPIAHAIAAFGTACGTLLPSGQFDLADKVLTTADPGTGTPEHAHMHGMVTLARSLCAASAGHRSDQTAALDHAADVATHIPSDTPTTGREWFGFGTPNVNVWRMSVAVETGDYNTATTIADTINPDTLPSPTRRVQYHITRARALCRVPSRRGDAVRALRAAETIAPTRVRSHQGARSVMVELAEQAKRDAVGRELRGLADRAGVDV